MIVATVKAMRVMNNIPTEYSNVSRVYARDDDDLAVSVDQGSLLCRISVHDRQYSASFRPNKVSHVKMENDFWVGL